ncbi:MAG: hypothetical protein EAZ95_05135 [Bacteroidetes bacterium]|nr:MAG: hypothetical protein EAZ95_05135 [Bacteroidota bacterium]
MSLIDKNIHDKDRTDRSVQKYVFFGNIKISLPALPYPALPQSIIFSEEFIFFCCFSQTNRYFYVGEV